MGLTSTSIATSLTTSAQRRRDTARVAKGVRRALRRFYRGPDADPEAPPPPRGPIQKNQSDHSPSPPSPSIAHSAAPSSPSSSSPVGSSGRDVVKPGLVVSPGSKAAAPGGLTLSSFTSSFSSSRSHRHRFEMWHAEWLPRGEGEDAPYDVAAVAGVVGVAKAQAGGGGGGRVGDGKKEDGISLRQCLDTWCEEEKLSADDKWHCPKCQDLVEADTKLDLWTLPKVLIIHLKRFISAGDKIDVPVDFPIEGLDLTDLALGKGTETSTSSRRQVYDLFAVSNHYDGLGGGHYTAFAKHAQSGKWHEYNDSSVRPMNASDTSPSDISPSAAYVLFYRRREPGQQQAQAQALGLLGQAQAQAQVPLLPLLPPLPPSPPSPSSLPSSLPSLPKRRVKKESKAKQRWRRPSSRLRIRSPSLPSITLFYTLPYVSRLPAINACTAVTSAPPTTTGWCAPVATSTLRINTANSTSARGGTTSSSP